MKTKPPEYEEYRNSSAEGNIYRYEGIHTEFSNELPSYCPQAPR
jgi:hypothetical protein